MTLKKKTSVASKKNKVLASTNKKKLDDIKLNTSIQKEQDARAMVQGLPAISQIMIGTTLMSITDAIDLRREGIIDNMYLSACLGIKQEHADAMLRRQTESYVKNGPFDIQDEPEYIVVEESQVVLQNEEV